VRSSRSDWCSIGADRFDAFIEATRRSFAWVTEANEHVFDRY
jgi:hypothetical protein